MSGIPGFRRSKIPGFAAVTAILAAYSVADGSVSNFSSRAQVLTGDNVVIAGLDVSGSGSKTVLIRGLGPSLASTGLKGLLADPTLSL